MKAYILELQEADDIESKSTRIPHSVEYSKGGYTLRSPKTTQEWEAYHTIRIAEIHDRYCPENVYNYEDPEEMKESNFRFVLLSPESTVLGTIRVDLLEKEMEASLRWVTIRLELQKQGFGQRMLELAEMFIASLGCNLIRVPTQEESRRFYEKFGYAYTEWSEGPKISGDIPLAKRL